MDMVVEIAPAVGIVALCAALGLSRATFYRRRRAAAPPTVPLLVTVGTEAAQPSGQSPEAVCGVGTEGATASPSGSALAASVDATRNGAVEPSHAGSATTSESAPIATASTIVPAMADEVDATPADTVAPPPVETTAVVVASTRATPAKKSPPRKIPDEERAAILGVLNEDRFCNLAPAAVWASLLDEGRHLCSERTMYRILDENRELRERRNQLRHPAYVAPELMATGPRQLWSWDITKLKTFVKSQYLHLYVILDVFSRYVVGWMVAERESGELAKALIDETCERQSITPGELTFHADNGAAMVSQPVAFLLASLGVVKSHSRPHVSDDNPFSEAQFKTLKYRPDFPTRFASLTHARTFLREFFDWYNNRHHHDALALLTPHDVHHGLVAERLAQRARVLDAAYAAHPERFVRGAPKPTAPPTTVWINPPKTPTESQEPRA
jgi:putative transposase